MQKNKRTSLAKPPNQKRDEYSAFDSGTKELEEESPAWLLCKANY